MHEPLCVTHIIVRLDTGGAERSLLRLVRGTHGALAHRVICFGTPTPIGDEISAAGGEVTYVDYRLGPLALWQAWRALKAQPPHILQGWMYYGDALASLLALVLPRRIRTVWNIRQSPADFALERRAIRWAIDLCRWSFMAPHLVIYNSFAGEQAHARFGYDRHPHTVIPNGIDLDEFQPSQAVRAASRQRYRVGDAPWVGMVSRYHPLKGVGAFVQAARKLLDMGAQAQFFLAGAGMDEGNAELAAELKAHGATRDEIALLGPIAEPAEFLPGVDVLVLASEREGTPNILIEAMACGVYTVATRAGDAARIVRDPVRLTEPGNVDGLAGIIRRGLCEHSDPAARIAAERAFLHSHYEAGLCAAKYLEHYRGLSEAAG